MSSRFFCLFDEILRMNDEVPVSDDEATSLPESEATSRPHNLNTYVQNSCSPVSSMSP